MTKLHFDFDLVSGHILMINSSKCFTVAFEQSQPSVVLCCLSQCRC